MHLRRRWPGPERRLRYEVEAAIDGVAPEQAVSMWVADVSDPDVDLEGVGQVHTWDLRHLSPMSEHRTSSVCVGQNVEDRPGVRDRTILQAYADGHPTLAVVLVV